MAAMRNNRNIADIAKLLIRHGADVNSRNFVSTTPLRISDKLPSHFVIRYCFVT